MYDKPIVALANQWDGNAGTLALKEERDENDSDWYGKLTIRE